MQDLLDTMSKCIKCGCIPSIKIKNCNTIIRKCKCKHFCYNCNNYKKKIMYMQNNVFIKLYSCKCYQSNKCTKCNTLYNISFDETIKVKCKCDLFITENYDNNGEYYKIINKSF